MPFGKDFAAVQIELIQRELPFYKEYCALIANPKTKNSERAAKLEREISSMLSPIVKAAYETGSESHIQPIEMHLVFKHFFDQQIAAIDAFDTLIAQRSVEALKKDIDGMPEDSKRELTHDLELVKAKIEKYAKAKTEIYEMTTPERKIYIDEAIERKQDPALIKFAEGVQDHIKAASSEHVSLTLDQLLATYSDLLNTYESPLLQRGTLEFAILAEEVRIFQEEITAKLLEELKAALSTDLKFVAPMLKFIKLVESIRDRFKAAHMDDNIKFLNTIVENTELLRGALEAITTILPSYKAGTYESLLCEEMGTFLSASLIAFNKLATIADPEQRKIITGLAIQQFVARLKALAPQGEHEELLEFPLLIPLDDDKIKLVDQAGALLSKEFFHKVEGKIEDAIQLPYYISVLSACQFYMTGEGLKKMLNCLLRLQTRFVETLPLEPLKMYQTSTFPKGAEAYNDFANIYIHLDTDLLKRELAKFTPQDRAAIHDFRIKLEKVINDRITELSPTRPRIS